MRHLLTLALVAASPLAAQAPASVVPPASAAVKKAAASITAADVAKRINIIADDSMMGRDTPSPGLEMTAQYVADQFKSFGLKPGGEKGTWFQRYEIVQTQFDAAASHVGFMAGGKHVHADFSTNARFLFGTPPDKEIGGAVVVLGGVADPAALEKVDAKGKIVLLVFDYSKGQVAGGWGSQLGSIFRMEPAGIVILSNRDSAAWATRMKPPYRKGVRMAGNESRAPLVDVNDAGLATVLSAGGVDVAKIRAETGMVVLDNASLKVMLDLKETVLNKTTAPNTIGILEGSDPKLKNEYLVYSAHMDHVGISSGKADSINNGADDDGSGTVGVIELAEAFSQPGARPKRSVLFITVSGEEKGLWGSDYFASHPTVPIKDMVADLNIDMIGRNWPDTIVAIGREHSDLGQTLEAVNAQHPELGMTAIDDKWPEENFYGRSDHFNFAKHGVPILFFFNGVHEDYHQVSDSPDKINSDKESRILQLLFYLGQAIANNPERPQWNPESYAKIVQPPKPAS
ncbi:MAG TPA: M28 family peptidase [Gemmatimonadales bacterium]|nr:M28 family peptidase [Gemmatimonadales bacterium]